MNIKQQFSGIKDYSEKRITFQKVGEGFLRFLRSPFPAFMIFFLFMLGLFSMVSLQEGDDLYFATMHNSFTLPDFLTMRFQTWSGRVFGETLFYLFIGPWFGLWKWLCALSATASAFIMWHFVTYKTFLGNKTKILFAYVICFSIGLISRENLSTSVFWVTGALVYLVPFSVALIAFLPFFKSIKDEKPVNSPVSLFFLIPAVLTAAGQEQISLTYTLSSLVVLIYLFTKKRKPSRVLLAILIGAIIVQVVCVMAPGNFRRFSSEINTWFPAYNEIQILSKLSLSGTFIFNTLINQWGLILLFLWITCGYLVIKAKRSTSSNVLGVILFLYAILTVYPLIQSDGSAQNGFSAILTSLFNFHYLTRSTFFRTEFFVPYLVWGIGILLIPFSINWVFKGTKYNLFYLLIFLASILSILMITFSPTIYASGGRTSFVSCMLLILLIMLLLRHENAIWLIGIAILAVSLRNLIRLYVYWSKDGFGLIYGTLDEKEIPFMVLGH